MLQKLISRRDMLKAAGVGLTATLLGACQPKIVEKIVKETVEVEKVVKEVVKETVMVEGEAKEVTKIVEKVVTVQPAAEPPMELLMCKWFGGGATEPIPDDDNYIETEIEKGFNVNITNWFFERWSWKEQFNTRVAGGEVPDFWTGEGVTLADYVDNELVCEVPIEMFATYEPRVFAATLKYMDGSLETWLSGNYQGKNYTKPWMTTTQTHPFCDGWRKDYLDKAGITRLPETLEEHGAALEAMVKSGACQYAVSPRLGDSILLTFINIHGAHGEFPNHWIPDGDSLVWGGITDKAKQACQVVQDYWKAGLINPESLTTKWPDLVNRWCQGLEGYVDCGTWYRLVPGGELYDCIAAAGGETEMAWAPKGPNGDYGYSGWGYIMMTQLFGAHLAKDEKKLTKLMEMQDMICGDSYWATLVTHGKQGDHWYRDPERGIVKKTIEELTMPVEKVGWMVSGYWEAVPDIWHSWQGNALPKQIEKAFAGNTKWLPNMSIFMDPEVCKDYTEAGPTQNKWYVDFYSGAKPLSEWDNYVNEYMAAGGECNTNNAKQGFETMSSQIAAIRAKVEAIIGG